MTMSASSSASALTVAPAAVNSESGKPDLMPAPGWTAISTPSALNFFTVSGEAATRCSDGSISLATAIFMGPPAARGARARANYRLFRNDGYRFCDRNARNFFGRAADGGVAGEFGQVRKIAIMATMKITEAVPYF